MRHPRTFGQALAEFALIVPIFVILLFGIIDLGRFAYTQNVLNQVSREAARVGSVTDRPQCTAATRDACIRELVAARSIGVIGQVTFDEDGLGGTMNDNGCYAVHPLTGAITKRASINDCRSGDLLKVKVQNSFRLLTPLIGQWVGNLNLTGEATVTVN
jgi:hypothetical protein